MSEVAQTTSGKGQPVTSAPDVAEDDRPNAEEDSDSDKNPADDIEEVDVSKLTGRQKKLFELRLKMVGINLNSVQVDNPAFKLFGFILFIYF